ncbi:hypothetical protein [Deinococcus hopiensis]|uniref:Uncharacterized protein n=1 Tax=Deinococcus hopiensis KR-140 TaxID=695939 RepID=A0A1W1VVQ5_9DEIO|nr:hypothetical protein [Deinococcus hopiensis]SMB97416.1 hypothetical protein SAMN00790413_05935 [Deinococcus hopiensis KR-140]
MWLAKRDDDRWAKVRLTPHEAWAARLVLEDPDIITCRTWKSYGNTTTHIAINEDRFLELMVEATNIPE